MLVLSRKPQETIVLDGGRITITVVEVRGSQVRLGIEAPRQVDVRRGELQPQQPQSIALDCEVAVA